MSRNKCRAVYWKQGRRKVLAEPREGSADPPGCHIPCSAGIGGDGQGLVGCKGASEVSKRGLLGVQQPGWQLRFQRFWEWPFWPWREGTGAVFDVGAQWVWPEPGFLWPAGDKAVHGVLLSFSV